MKAARSPGFDIAPKQGTTRPSAGKNLGCGQFRIVELQQKIGNRAVTRLLAGNMPALRSQRPGLPALALKVMDQPGTPLTSPVRQPLEARLGHDLGHVRIHTDLAASRAARLLGAKAFTWGQHIVFGQGRFSPYTNSGQEVLGHELAHVIQQGRLAGQKTSRRPDHPLETAARQAGREMAHGTGPVPVAGAAAPGLARDPLGPGIFQPAELSDDELYQEIQETRQWLLTHVGNPEFDLMEDWHRQLEYEVDRRPSGPTAASPPGPVSRPGGRESASVTPTPPVSQPPGGGVLATARTSGGIIPSLGRLYPFARTPTPGELAAIRSGQALHYTPAGNLPGISPSEGVVQVRPSAGIYRNLLTPGFRPSSYFFLGQPTSLQQFLNIAGRGSLSEQGLVIVQGADLPPGTLFRPMDRVIVVPEGYHGPGAAVPPRGQIPLPLRLPTGGGTTPAPPRTTVTPRSGTPGTGGAALGLGLGVVSGLARQAAMQRQVETEGYAPVGPSAFAEEGLLMRLGRWLQDPFLGALTPASSRFNVTVWRANVRRRAAAVRPGGSLTVNWQFRSDPMAIFPNDVYVTYDKLPDGSWRARAPADAPRGFTTPDLNRIIDPNVSDQEVQNMLFSSPWA